MVTSENHITDTMNKHEKLRLAILSRQSDANVDFTALCNMLQHFGFDMRIRSSHHVFKKPSVPERITLQPQGRHAKPYQVRQVRKVLEDYQIGQRA